MFALSTHLGLELEFTQGQITMRAMEWRRYRPGQTLTREISLGVHAKNCLDIENNHNWVNKLYSRLGGGTTIQGQQCCD